MPRRRRSFFFDNVHKKLKINTLETTKTSRATTSAGLKLEGYLDANGNKIDMGTNEITDAKVGQWNTAYGWGDHASAGYTTYGNSDVDSHLNQSNPTSGYVLSWNGSDYAWVEQSGGDVVDDTTPELGGDLDVNNFKITSGNVSSNTDYANVYGETLLIESGYGTNNGFGGWGLGGNINIVSPFGQGFNGKRGNISTTSDAITFNSITAEFKNISSALAAQIRLYEASANGSNFVRFFAPTSIASSIDFTLPSSDGTSGQVLTTNGSGTLSFSSIDVSASSSIVGRTTTQTITGTKTFSNAIQLVDTNTKIGEGSGNSVRFTTNSGYVDIGPMNSSWCHFSTDRGQFYFGQNVQVDGQIYKYSGTVYWGAHNDGSGSGLDADTLDGYQLSSIKTNSSTDTNSIWIRNASPTIYFRDTDHRGCMLHNNSNLFYVLRGSQATDSTSWATVNGRWPLTINLGNNDATFGGNVTAYSDARLKENVEPIGITIEQFKSLEAKRFDWKADGKHDVGFIAQDVEAAGLVEVVKEHEDRDPGTGELLDTYKTLDYARMVPFLWDIVQKQQKQIEELQAKIS